MVDIWKTLKNRWGDLDSIFLISNHKEYTVKDLFNSRIDLECIKEGSVVGLVGDMNAITASSFLRLIEKKTIIIPLSLQTIETHSKLLNICSAEYVVKDECVIQLEPNQDCELVKEFKKLNEPGLILFSSGTTGAPKAILHNLSNMINSYQTYRPIDRVLSFLFFDHIGGINTFLHTLFNTGVLISVDDRSVANIFEICKKYSIKVLPTTPTFLRFALYSGLIPSNFPTSIELVTYGTEVMDQATLERLCELLPAVKFKQTYGMSELGIMSLKSKAKDSLYIKLNDEVEYKIFDSVLYLKNSSQMYGYINYPSPFDSDGWYCTDDIVVEGEDGYFKIIGRRGQIVNVAGLKFSLTEVENVALSFPGILLVSAVIADNPVTGHHVEVTIEPSVEDFSKVDFLNYIKKKLPAHMVPRRVRVSSIEVSYRFKKK